MVKRLRKVGNSNALILDRAVMELIGLEDCGKVAVTVNNGSLLITPVNPQPISRREFERRLSEVVRRRRPALGRLAQ